MSFQQTLGIKVKELTANKAVVTLLITDALKQPHGFLHGGVSVALAEHAASLGAEQSLAEDQVVFGIEVNANHLYPKRSGELTAIAAPIHQGNVTQVWEVKISDEKQRLVCISRCSLIVKKKGKNK